MKKPFRRPYLCEPCIPLSWAQIPSYKCFYVLATSSTSLHQEVPVKPKPMKRVFVCSPYRGDVKENTKLAWRLCRAVCDAGHAPFAPHTFYTEFLDDVLESERNLGIACGLAWLGQADEIWVYAEDFTSCSMGMKAEIEQALKFSIPPEVKYMPKAFQLVEPPPQPRITLPPPSPSPESRLEVE